MKLTSLDRIQADRVSHDRDIVRRILLGEDDLPCSVRLSHALLSPGQRVSAHCHEQVFEVFYVLAGRGVLMVDGSCYDICQGSCFVVEAGEVHAITNGVDAEMALLYFGLPSSSA